MDVLIRPWRLYADFSGRSRRLELLLFNLVFCAVGGALFVILSRRTGTDIFASDAKAIDLAFGDPVVLGALLLLFGVTLIPSLALSVRRLHDQGKSGWFFLVTLVPWVGGLIWLVLALWPGDRGENEYGPDPRNPDRATMPRDRWEPPSTTTRDFPPRP